MKYTTEYLTKQLEEATEISRSLTAKLNAEPDSRGLKIALRSMNDHIEEIRKDLAEAQSEEGAAHVESANARQGVAAVG